MPTATEIHDASFASGFTPEPNLTVSAWADEYRMLVGKASSEPGFWRTSRTPYLREIMDVLSPANKAQRVVFMKGSQLGGSECGNNFLGYIIHHAAAPTLMVLPTVEVARRFSRQRLDPVIAAMPVLASRVQESRSRDGGNTMLTKEFPGGIVILTGANSAAGLKSMPIRYLFCDEVDEYPGDVEGQGDPVYLAEKRTTTFARRKVFLVSTPTIKDLSRIEKEYLASDRRRYFVPCSHCGEYDWIRWENIRWDEGDPSTAALVCVHCGGVIPEHEKTALLANGEWRATATSESGTIGFHLSRTHFKTLRSVSRAHAM